RKLRARSQRDVPRLESPRAASQPRARKPLPAEDQRGVPRPASPRGASRLLERQRRPPRAVSRLLGGNQRAARPPSARVGVSSDGPSPVGPVLLAPARGALEPLRPQIV